MLTNIKQSIHLNVDVKFAKINGKRKIPLWSNWIRRNFAKVENAGSSPARGAK